MYMLPRAVHYFWLRSSTNHGLREMSTQEGYYHEGYFHENQVSSTDNDSYCSSWCSPLKCTNKVPPLRLGHCVTFEEDEGIYVYHMLPLITFS